MNTGSAVQTTDDAGSSHFPLAGNFNGWFLVNRSDLLPYRFYPGPFPAGPPVITDPLAVVSQAGANDFVAALGANVAQSFDAGSGLGLVFISVYDCNDHLAPGVSFSISNPGPNNIVFYTAGGFPSTTATHTDRGGAGGFINVPAMPQTVRATTLIGTPLTPIDIAVNPATVSQVFFRARTTH
jgi:hypothetical protein